MTFGWASAGQREVVFYTSPLWGNWRWEGQAFWIPLTTLGKDLPRLETMLQALNEKGGSAPAAGEGTTTKPSEGDQDTGRVPSFY